MLVRQNSIRSAQNDVVTSRGKTADCTQLNLTMIVLLKSLKFNPVQVKMLLMHQHKNNLMPLKILEPLIATRPSVLMVHY